MNRGVVLVALLALSIGINIGLMYWQVGAPGGPARPSGPPENLDRMLNNHLDRLADGLELDDQQRAQIAEVLEEYIPLVLAQSARVDTARRQLAATYQAEPWDPQAFRDAVSGLRDAQTELDRVVGEAMIGEASALTDEQRRLYARGSPWSSLIGATEEPGPGGRGGRGGRRPPPKKKR